MYTFILSLVILILGYIFYGKYVDNVFGSDENRPTPAITQPDGVDYVPLSTFKSLFIQFLNVVGTGPIFGAIAGVAFGPMAFVWIVLGCIFAGAVHDFFSGMLSVRMKGATVGEIVGDNLGEVARQIMRVFSIVLLVLVGVVFLTSPAQILTTLVTGSVKNHTVYNIFLVVIFLYYILATVLPVDKLIGRLYPLFGLALFFMAVGISISLIYMNITGKYYTPEITELAKGLNYHPKLTLFPFLFISIACGAISGFHATQSPIIARCITNEKEGRKVFYAAMIGEGIVAVIWAAASITLFAPGTDHTLAGHLTGLAAVGKAPVVVNAVAKMTLGSVGSVLAVLGVVAAPITSGDTAFRGARLTIADILHIDQKSIKNRYLIALPLFAIGAILSQVDFNIIWRYFAWSNQTLAMIGLWSASVWLLNRKKNYLITLLPALFMTLVSVSYIVIAPEGFGRFFTNEEGVLSSSAGIVGFVIALVVAIIGLVAFLKKKAQLEANNEYLKD